MQSIWKHRRAVLERGPSGRFGRRRARPPGGSSRCSLPLLAPLVDIFLIYGLLFLHPVTTLVAWSAVLGVQLVWPR